MNPLLRGELLFPSLLTRRRVQDRPAIDRIEDLLEEYRDGRVGFPLTLDDLASIGSMSPSHLCRLFKELTDMRPLEYINLLRVNSAALMIQSGSCSMLKAALENGFQHLSYFSKQFKKYKGMSPSAFKHLQGKASFPN